MTDYHVVIKDMPPTIRGFTVQETDFVTIVINSRLNRETQLEAYKHEIKHIRNDDFKRKDIQLIEMEAHCEKS